MTTYAITEEQLRGFEKNGVSIKSQIIAAEVRKHPLPATAAPDAPKYFITDSESDFVGTCDDCKAYHESFGEPCPCGPEHDAALLAAAREQWEREQDPCAANGCTDTENCDEICEHMRIYSPAYVRKARADAAKASKIQMTENILDAIQAVCNTDSQQIFGTEIIVVEKIRSAIMNLRASTGGGP